MTEDDSSERSRRILRSLLAPVPDGAGTWGVDEYRSLLEHQMGTSLRAEREVLDPAGSESWARVVAQMEERGLRTFGDVLRDPAPPAEGLRMVKDFAKDSISRGDGLPPDVARVLYVLAVTQRPETGAPSVSSLDPSLREREAHRCLTFAWLPDDVRKLLRVRLRAL